MWSFVGRAVASFRSSGANWECWKARSRFWRSEEGEGGGESQVTRPVGISRTHMLTLPNDNLFNRYKYAIDMLSNPKQSCRSSIVVWPQTMDWGKVFTQWKSARDQTRQPSAGHSLFRVHSMPEGLLTALQPMSPPRASRSHKQIGTGWQLVEAFRSSTGMWGMRFHCSSYFYRDMNKYIVYIYRERGKKVML